jgi:hypothetical protein
MTDTQSTSPQEIDPSSVSANANTHIVGHSVPLNLCSGCKRNFSGAQAHAIHRVGEFNRKQRRCLTSDEMLARGFTMTIEPVRRCVEGKYFHEQMETWHRPTNEKEQARLARMKAGAA